MIKRSKKLLQEATTPRARSRLSERSRLQCSITRSSCSFISGKRDFLPNPRRSSPSPMETALIAYRNRVAFEYSYARYHPRPQGAGRGWTAPSPRCVATRWPPPTPRLAAEGGLGDEQSHASGTHPEARGPATSPPIRRIGFEVEYAELTGKRFRIRGGEEPLKTLLALKVIRNNRHLVILGAPGVGKSALVRFLAGPAR